jgi:hypothetical protein
MVLKSVLQPPHKCLDTEIQSIREALSLLVIFLVLLEDVFLNYKARSVVSFLLSISFILFQRMPPFPCKETAGHSKLFLELFLRAVVSSEKLWRRVRHVYRKRKEMHWSKNKMDNSHRWMQLEMRKSASKGEWKREMSICCSSWIIACTEMMRKRNMFHCVLLPVWTASSLPWFQFECLCLSWIKLRKRRPHQFKVKDRHVIKGLTTGTTEHISDEGSLFRAKKKCLFRFSMSCLSCTNFLPVFIIILKPFSLIAFLLPMSTLVTFFSLLVSSCIV